MADTTADAGAHGSDNAGGDQPFKIFKTQAEFDAFAAGIREAAQRRASKSTGATEAELDTLRTQVSQFQQSELEAKGKYEEAKAAIQRAAEEQTSKAKAAADKAIAALRKHLIDAQLRALAEAKGAYNPADVVVHLKDRIELDEDFNVRVRSTDGSGAVQDGVSLEDAVVELLKANPHLAKATGTGTAAGAGGGKSVSGSLSGSPAQREAQAAYDKAIEAAKANPQNAAAIDAVMRAKAALRAAQ